MGYVIKFLEYLITNPIVLVALVLLYFALFSISLIWAPRKSGPNPFKCDARRIPEQLVNDASARAKVLKVGFQSRFVPDDLDAVVIGSGIGGLATAALLSKAGKKVLVLEQHDQAGGCCHTFCENGFEFDVGIHYIGDMRENTENKFLLDQLSHGQIQWDDLDNDFDLVGIGSEKKNMKFLPLCGGGYNAFKSRLMEYFPGERSAIEKYINLLKKADRSIIFLVLFKFLPKWVARFLIRMKVFHVVSSYFTLVDKTLEEMLRELTDNKELRSVLSYAFGDYGVEPSRSSFLFHAILTNHYMKGASYPRGGASEIAYHIIPVIEEAGGKVLVRAKVKEIILEKGKAVGVRMDRAGITTDIRARMVISDAGVFNTFTRLLPREAAELSELFCHTEKKLKVGLSAFSLFVGFGVHSSELGIKKQNVWLLPSDDLSAQMDAFLKKSLDEALDSEIPLMFLSSPSVRDSSYEMRHPGKATLTVVMPGQWSWYKEWERERVKNRGDDYMARKGALMRKIWERVLSIYPSLEDKVEYMEMGTGLSNNFYLNSVEGEIYGLDHPKERFADPGLLIHLRPETGIPGLLLTGQDVFCCGLMGALTGAMLAASSALNRNLFFDLKHLYNQSKENNKLDDIKKNN